MAATNRLVEQLLKEPREVREAAVEALLDSLDAEDGVAFDPSVEDAWHEEIESRLKDREPGIPAETVFAEGVARLNKRS